jgi:hypothetical protein
MTDMLTRPQPESVEQAAVTAEHPLAGLLRAAAPARPAARGPHDRRLPGPSGALCRCRRPRWAVGGGCGCPPRVGVRAHADRARGSRRPAPGRGARHPARGTDPTGARPARRAQATAGRASGSVVAGRSGPSGVGRLPHRRRRLHRCRRRRHRDRAGTRWPVGPVGRARRRRPALAARIDGCAGPRAARGSPDRRARRPVRLGSCLRRDERADLPVRRVPGDRRRGAVPHPAGTPTWFP